VLVLIFSLALIPLFYVFGESIASIFVDNLEVIDISAKALRVTSLFYFGLGMIYVPRALLNGCGDAAFAILNGLVEVAGRVAFSQLFLLIPGLGWLVVWLTTGATWAVTGLVCLIRYWMGNWKKHVEMKTMIEKTA
jgi:Na+-driven multidrug efflux pump